MPWEQEPLASVSTAFSNSSKFLRLILSLDKNTENMFPIYIRKHRKKGKQLLYFDHQNLNSLCFRPALIESTTRAILCYHLTNRLHVARASLFSNGSQMTSK